MPSELGSTIKARRTSLGIGLRELARRIDKSPTFVSILENSDDPPTGSEATLRKIEDELELPRDTLVTLAGKTPEDVAPKSSEDAALYRKVKGLRDWEKRQVMEYLEKFGEGEDKAK
jgi:transcriptional regulator with XRE-family HTH domain